MKIKRICDIHQQGAANITLVDAIGNNIAIPMEFCSTYAVRCVNIAIFILQIEKVTVPSGFSLYILQKPPNTGLKLSQTR